MRYITCIFISLVCLWGCMPQKDDDTSGDIASNTTQTPAKSKSDTVTIFLSGDTLSQLKPCGCAEGQLGGFSRRKVIFDSVEAEKRLLVDTGNFLIDQTPQDMVKLNTIISSLSALGYDVVNFNDDDLKAVLNGYTIEQMPFKVIGTAEQLENVFRRDFIGKNVTTVQVAAVSSKAIEEGSLTSEFIEKLFPANNMASNFVNILLTDNFNDDIADFLARSNVVDVAVCNYESDYPSIIKTDHEKPLFVSVGKKGKYVGKLELTLSGKGTELAYSKVAVDKKLKSSPELDHIYEGYRQMVRIEDLLGKVIRTPLPDGLEYVGSDKCKGCHEYAYKKWSKMPHAHAYQTLVDSGDVYDPECIECHVVGLKYDSGFKNENSPKGLRNVGCEVCHGPRSKHIKIAMDDTEKLKKSEPVAALDCISCHTPEHSPGFQTDEAGYRKKNLHIEEQK